MKAATVYLVLAGSFQMFALVACAQPIKDDVFLDLKRDVQSQSRDVLVLGSIVSVAGFAVDNVKIEYYVRRFGDVLTDKPKEFKTIVGDGEFRIEENDVTSLTIWLHKSGYYPQQWSYVVSEDSQVSDPGILRTLEIEIPLIKEPEPAPLKRLSGVLGSAPDRQTRVLRIPRDSQDRGRVRGTDSTKFNGGTDENFIFLDAVAGADGNLAAVKAKSNGTATLGDSLERGWIRLGHMGPGEGFVVFMPDGVLTRPELGFRQMNEAPEEGYLPEIELSGEEGPDYVYFYCRFDGRFGKGLVNAKPVIDVRDGRQVALSRIVLFVNPTGSRDVAFLHD